jgi:hypothetical protein
MTSIHALLAFILTYYFAAVVQAVLHRVFGHHDRIHAVFETHAKGHHRKYPPQRLLSETWIESEQHIMWYYALPFVPTAALVFWLGGPGIFLGHLLGLGFAIWWHIYLHEQYHLRNSPWGRFQWFRQKRDLHFIHHRDVHKNYAIVEYWLDTVLGTKMSPETSPPKRP